MTQNDTKYRVLARKYRPATFADLIGQDALVRTLTNALETGKVAQAYILTGIRGIGKTTSARIIAKALNCTGTDGKGAMTAQPCGECEHCKAIAAGTHIDVTEIDAASNTGVDNVREIIEGTRYSPTSARYKIYIIDEVHMLSKAAFNALLKTLEEPPESVKFIFATTEIRKVPATILSRCQRFDLRRVDADLLTQHFKNVLQKEGLDAQEDALRLIAKAADGSVRDGLSLLDQAIAHSGGKIETDFVRSMIGLADKTAILDLYAAITGGKIQQALNVFEEQYALGADPVAVIQDLLELTHFLTRAKLSANLLDDSVMGSAERDKCKEMVRAFSMSLLARLWQMLLKGLQETANAPNEKQAAEMLLIRLAYMADLPSPQELYEKVRNAPQTTSNAPAAPSAPTKTPATFAPQGVSSPAPQSAPLFSGNVVPASAPVQSDARQTFLSLADVVEYAMKQNPLFAFHLQNFVSLTKFEQGKIEFYPLENAPKSLCADIQKNLSAWTGRPWLVSVLSEKKGQTLKQEADRKIEAAKTQFESHPLTAKILELFPQATIENVRLRKEETGNTDNTSEDQDLETENNE